jgi:hypothetical protein
MGHLSNVKQLKKDYIEYYVVRFKNNADKGIVRCFRHKTIEAQWTR